MKTIKFLVIILMAGSLINGCKPLEVEEDVVAPGKIELHSVEPVPGGFAISYNLPDDEDLLYILAEYDIRPDKPSQVKTSAYQSNLTVFGFGDTLQKTVKVYAVDRHSNKSEPVEFTGNPLEPPVSTIQKSLTFAPDFGGVKYEWVNETNAPVSIILYAEDSTGTMEPFHTIYTSVDSGLFSIRGFEPEPRKFSAIVRDRWDNLSSEKFPETEDGIITPFYEARLDKTKFREVVPNLTNDTDWNAWEGSFENAFDDDYQTFVHSQGDHAMPQIQTIDLGVKVRLSRIVVHQRGLEQSMWAFTHGNPMTYDLYGGMDLGDNSGNLNDWLFLRSCKSEKPSGLPNGQNSDEDMIRFFAGDEYSFNDPPEIRYFRFAVQSTWDGAGFINYSELTFWGDIIEEYN